MISIVLRVVLLAALLGTALGCAAPDRPRHRFGCLPFPGLFTLFELADADDLGEHRYNPPPPLDPDYNEQSRGILYTRQAGFLDVAHIRFTADTVRYLAREIEPALRNGQASLAIESADATTLHLDFRYPPEWDTMRPDERDTWISDLTLAVAAKAAYDLGNWHEIVTWFNYREFLIIPEKPSAFSYEDVVSHIVGVEVAVRALRDTRRDYDAAVTAALAQRLRELEVVTADQTMEAIYAVVDNWWAWGQPRKRHLDLGLDDGAVTPWLVRGVPFAKAGPPEPMPIPSLSDVAGRDMTGLVEVTLTTDAFTSLPIKRLFNPPAKTFRAEEHFPTILAAVLDQMVNRYGPQVNKPYLSEHSARASLH